MEQVSKAQVYAFLSDPRNKFAVLSTISALTGAPESALMGMAVTPELEIVFDTVRTSRKYENLRKDPRCAVVSGLGGEVTVQYEGEVRELTVDSPLVRNVYFTAFPDGPSRVAWPGIVYFAIRPTWLRFSDYGETPHQIGEIRF